MPSPEDHSLDLFWHALNYRTAATQHADLMWHELDACVKRLLDEAKADTADDYRDWIDRNTDARW